LGEHGGEAQSVAFVGVDDEFVGAARQGNAHGIGANGHGGHTGVCAMAVSEDGAATHQQQHGK